MVDVGKYKHYHSNAIETEEYVTPEDEIRVPVEDKSKANLISSEAGVVFNTNYHHLMLDLDIQHKYIPSSTEGHGHLIIDHPIPEDTMWEILDLLVTAGILQKAFVDLAKRRGAVFLRHPDHPKKKESVTIVEDDAITDRNTVYFLPPNLV